MREYGSNINLPSLDNLFSSEQERQDAKLEKIYSRHNRMTVQTPKLCVPSLSAILL